MSGYQPFSAFVLLGGKKKRKRKSKQKNQWLNAYDAAVDEVLQAKNLKRAREALWRAFEHQRLFRTPGMRILIMNAPCNGFGDLIFAKKLGEYLRSWYGAKVKIASTLPNQLKQLGEKTSNIIPIITGKNKQCRRFRLLSLKEQLPRQDLIFVAPIQSDFQVDLRDVQHIVPYATRTNTFFFSEYNDKSTRTDFPTGVGANRFGILLTDPPSNSRPQALPNPYVLMYISQNVARAPQCMFSFIHMVATKYAGTHSKLDIVVPTWISEEQEYEYITARCQDLPYDVVRLRVRGGNTIQLCTAGEGVMQSILTLRADIYPVPNKKMFGLIQHSLRDILITGDQSLTDVISCGSKNIFYQIVDWKQNFAKHLARLLPNEYLEKKRTSCGTIGAINYQSEYTKFTGEWDFRKKARPKMDAIVAAAFARKKNKHIYQLAKDIDTSRTLAALKNLYN
mgnify:FL=1